VDGVSTFRLSAIRPATVAALVRRDFEIVRSYRLQFVFDLFYGVANVLLFYFISRTFDGADADLGAAPSYFAFAMVGIAIMVVVGAATSGLVARLREEQLTGTLEALVAQPTTSTDIALGLAGFPFVLASLRAAIYVIAGGFLFGVGLGEADWAGFVLILLGTAFALTAIGVAFGAIVLLFKRGDVFGGMVIFAMGIAGGAYFPVTVLPDWLAPLSAVVPTRFAFDGLRAAVFEGGGWGDDLAKLVLVGVLLLPLALWGFERSMRRVHRTGTIAQY
jgi:ABC-2 type transport system permease protein